MNEFEQNSRRAHAERVFVEFETFYEPWGRWLTNRVHPMPDGGLSVFFQDITEHKRAQEALREADRRKDQFLAMLGHELRNPLAIISTSVQLLRRRVPAEAGVEALRDSIERQVTQMARLLDDLLDIARITQNKIQPRKSGSILLRWCARPPRTSDGV